MGYSIAACIDNNLNTSEMILKKIKPVPGTAFPPDLPDGVQPLQIIRRPGSGVVGDYFRPPIDAIDVIGVRTHIFAHAIIPTKKNSGWGLFPKGIHLGKYPFIKKISFSCESNIHEKIIIFS